MSVDITRANATSSIISPHVDETIGVKSRPMMKNPTVGKYGSVSWPLQREERSATYHEQFLKENAIALLPQRDILIRAIVA